LKYFEATTFVASWDQEAGTSTFCCSKTTSPRSFEIDAVRTSHSISSYGWTPGVEKYRSNTRPGPGPNRLSNPGKTSSRTADALFGMLPLLSVSRRESAPRPLPVVLLSSPPAGAPGICPSSPGGHEGRCPARPQRPLM
jgi:hypothetical protein